MVHVQGLRCRECGREYDVAPIYTCEWCFGPIEVAYDYDAIAGAVSREKIAAGPLSLWRYSDLLPVACDAAADLGTGFTPLVKADRLAAALGLGEVWVKNDTRNPTNSFKDRVVGVALSKALEFGFKVVGVRVDREPRELGGGARGARRAAQLRVHPREPRAGQGRHDRGVRRQPRGDQRQLRRRQPALRRARRRLRVGVREREHAAVLRGRQQDAGVRDRGAARLAGPRPRRRAGRERIAAHEDPQGLRRVVQGRVARRSAARARVGRAGARVLADRAVRSSTAPTRSGR